MIKTLMGLFWGKRNENGVWLAAKSKFRILTPKEKNFDAIYLAIWKLRIRILKDRKRRLV